MAVASWMISGRIGRINRGKITAEEDLYKLDKDKTPKQNVCDILRGICSRSSVFYDIVSIKTGNNGSPGSRDDSGNIKSLTKTIISDNKRLSYLNALVKLLSKDETRQQMGFSSEELLCCLRVSLVHESTLVRAGTLRVMRYVLKTEADIVAFNSLRLPYLVSRCIDVVLKNEMERIQALKVIRRTMRLGAQQTEAALARVMLAVPAAAPEDKDRLMRACLAALCELGVLNPTLFIETGCVAAITRAILDCQTPRIAESLCGVLLHLLNHPSTREPAQVDLKCLAAPYCDFHYRHGWMDKNRDEREMRFTCSRLSLLSVLRSWPGLLHFCDPMNKSGLRAIVQVLYLNQLEVRKAVLDLLYELLGLPQPEWTDEICVALAAVDPSDFQDSWRLSEGFVAAEGRSILPHLAATGPNIMELHLSILLYCFYEVGLLDALVEVMVTSDTFISVRATVLLGQLLHLIHLLLPPQVCHISPALPALLSRAAKAHPQALAALSALQSLNTLLRSRPASYSLFLDLVIQSCDPNMQPHRTVTDNSPRVPRSKSESSKGIYKYPEDSMDVLNDDDLDLNQSGRSTESKANYSLKNESALVKSKSITGRTTAVVNKVVRTKKLFNLLENLKENDNLIRDSNVFHKEKLGYTWNWNVIRAILKERVWGVEQFLLVKRLIHYLRPSSNKFSHTDLLQAGAANTRDQAQTALLLISYLLYLKEPEAGKLLEELFVDIANHISAISGSRSAHECLFSPQHMTNTMCQLYFLFIGRLCSTKEGLVIFRDTGLYENLLRLAVTTHHSCYVKLIISSLDYTINSYPRLILAQASVSKIESTRLYVVQFLNVLLRARQKAEEINNKHNGVKRSFTDFSEADTSLSSSNNEELDMSRSWTVDTCSEMDAWILELLVQRARDESKAVSISALNTLEEACNVPAYLNKLVTMKPHVKDLGDKGYLLWVRFIGSVSGFQALVEAGYVRRQIRYWVEHYNYRYTRLVEGEIHDCLTLLQRAEDGRYRRRVTSGPTTARKCVPFPVHLYAQLPRHPLGRDLLARHADLQQLSKCIKQGACNTDQEIMDLKSALWACGHTATSTPGIELLLSYNNVFADTVHLAQTSPVYSIRGTAFYVLGLMGCTYEGANILHSLGWLCVRHDRHESWPIIQEENWLTKSASEDALFNNLYQSSKKDEKKVTEGETSENSDKVDQSVSEVSFSDNVKPSAKIGGVEQSLTEESCDSCDGDILEDKLDTDKFNVRSISESSDRPERRIKCQTLPQRYYQGTRKHQRSLSESKTVDKFKTEDEPAENVQERIFHIGSIIENKPWKQVTTEGMFVWNDPMIMRNMRIRNNSESSTSGVSSCDSVLGRYFYNDRILTLSPIPSSSSLSAMKSMYVPNKRQSERARRISLHSFTGCSDVASSPPSQRDLIGYAALRNLSSHRRPTQSDGFATEINEFLSNEPAKVTTFGSLRGKPKQSDAHSTKMSIFKYDWKPIADKGYSSVESSHKTVYGMMGVGTSNIRDGSSQPSTKHPLPTGPIYVGISMPRNLIDLFPSSVQCRTRNQYQDDSLVLDVTQQDMAARKNDDSNFNSSYSDLSVGNGAKSSSRMTRHPSRDRFSKHDTLSCLYCSRLKVTVEVKKTSDLREAFFAGMDSPKPSSSGGVHTTVKSPAPAGGLISASLDVSCGSPTSLESNLSKISDGNPNVAGEVVKHSERMGNPICYKPSRQALLALKQKHPEAFQNVCLYSEICKLISQNTYRLGARRFLQELFLDLNFDVLYVEPLQIIQNKLAEIELESG